jgi:hypothetical protein
MVVPFRNTPSALASLPELCEQHAESTSKRAETDETPSERSKN